MNNTSNISLDTNSTNDLRTRVIATMQARKLSIRQLAQEIDYAKTAVGLWLRGKYRVADDAAIVAAFGRWLSRNAEYAPLNDDPRSIVPTYIETPSSERICSVLAHAHTSCRMGLIYGGPGVGKTTSIRHYMATYPERVWLATMTPSCSGLVSALECVAGALGLGIPNGGARRISNVIRDVLADGRALLIIDEAQHLSMAAIEELRSIHDATGAALVFTGNETSYARLTGGARSAHYAQIFSRIGVRLSIPRPTEDDVRTVCDAWGVDDAPARDFLRRLALQPGALRSVSMVLAMVHQAGKPFTCAAFKGACKILGAEV